MSEPSTDMTPEDFWRSVGEWAVEQGIWKPEAAALPAAPAAQTSEPRTVPRGADTGADRIAAERQRQIEVEGYDPVNDANDHDPRELEQAAVTYLLDDPDRWPWANSPKFGPNRIRELEKAGALIAAAIDVRLYWRAATGPDAKEAGER